MKKTARPKRTNVFTGIDVGSTNIRCSIIENDLLENKTRLLGIGTAESTGIKQGSIINREIFIEQMEKAIVDAEKTANIKVENVWLSVSGEHIRGINTQGAIAIKGHGSGSVGSKNLGKITDADDKRVLEMAKAISFPTDREILLFSPKNTLLM